MVVLTHLPAGGGVGCGQGKRGAYERHYRVASYPGVGTRFTIRIPLTVAIIERFSSRAPGRFYLAAGSVSEIVRYRYRERTRSRVSRSSLCVGTPSIGHLTQLTRLPVNRTDDEHKFIVVVATSFREVGLVVDGLVGEREVVIKSIEQDFHSSTVSRAQPSWATVRFH